MTNQSNIINDLGTFTKIPNKILNELVAKAELCIGSAINDALLAHEPTIILNIGIGTLSIELATMQCKFMPSKSLKTTIKKSIDDGVDPVEIVLEKELVDKLLKICDEAC